MGDKTFGRSPAFLECKIGCFPPKTCWENRLQLLLELYIYVRSASSSWSPYFAALTDVLRRKTLRPQPLLLPSSGPAGKPHCEREQLR